MQTLHNKSVLLIISGGIAAYKSLELIRLIKKAGGSVKAILTEGGKQFVTPLSVQSLSGEKVYDDLWSLTDEHEMGHIELSRSADVILVAPASTNLIAQMAHGLAQDLASTCLLATDKPVIIAPAMNVRMWENPATQDNIQTLKSRNIHFIGPDEGDMACGEYGLGRMSEPEDILSALDSFFLSTAQPLKGKHVLITAGPTYEPIDPVRYIGNRSSGKQGYAIAEACIITGAEVTLVSGPTNLPDIHGTKMHRVETAQEMLAASEKSLPADIAICAAAVADWATESSNHKIKKNDGTLPSLTFKENPDILKTISQHRNRPSLVIGFSLETENLEQNAKEKRLRKGCDWIIANKTTNENAAFGSDNNQITLINAGDTESWPVLSKKDIAAKLVEAIADFFYDNNNITRLKG